MKTEKEIRKELESLELKSGYEGYYGERIFALRWVLDTNLIDNDST